MQRLSTTKLYRPTIKHPLILSLFSIQLLCFFILALPTSITAHAQEGNVEEWHYTLRPGDTLQEISLNLLNHKYNWGDVVQYNRIDQHVAVTPGSIVKIPMHWLKHQPKPANVKSLSGNVQIKKASSSRYKTLKKNTFIRVGDEVATRNGNVVIEFADGSTIRLEKNSNLIFNKLSHFGKTGMVDTRLRLKKGSLTTDIPPLVKGSRYEIKTPSAVAAIRGTEFRLHSTENQTRLEVLEGTVAFSGEHGVVMVDAGKGATITNENSRIDVTNLPITPNTQIMQSNMNGHPTLVEWDKVKGANAYQIQLTEKDKNGKLIRSSLQTDTSIELSHIKNGDYALAIRSINAAGYEGIDSISKLSVDMKPIEIQLLAPQNGTTLEPKNGALLDDFLPAFSWSYSQDSNIPVLSRLDIAIDNEFTALISDHEFQEITDMTLQEPLIPGQYFWRVASLTNDTELNFSDSHVFRVKGSLPPIQILSVNYLEKQVGLFWSPVPNAKSYILQVSNKIDFSTIMKEEKLNKPRAHLLLNEGERYYARVKGLGGELYSSEFGPTQEILIEPN